MNEGRLFAALASFVSCSWRQVAPLPCFCSNVSVPAARKHPLTQILIFDVDGVLVDVRGTYWRSALQTVRHISGKRVTYAELHRWKSKPGFNDDWRSEEHTSELQ